MAKYLFHVSYTADGTKGLLQEGGTKRQANAEELVKGLGGKVEGFYFAFGASDGYLIADLPDAASAAALSLTVGASGKVRVTTTPLLSAAEIDAACKKKVSYRPPGA